MTNNAYAFPDHTAADLKAALKYLAVMREQCLDEDGYEKQGAVTAHMLLASTRLSSVQFQVLSSLVNLAREEADWEPGFDFSGDHGMSEDGSAWSWTIDTRAKPGNARELTIECEGDTCGIYLRTVSPVEDDGMHSIIPLAEARISRADLLKLLEASAPAVE